jgi:hypothetical protein
MTWNHHNAHLEDINGRKAYARIECDKHTPTIISAHIGYFQHDGVVGYDVFNSIADNDQKGEMQLFQRIKQWANRHGLKFTSEELTEFSNLKQKE